MATPENKTQRRIQLKDAALLCLLAAASFLAYSNNFTAEFVYDDYPFIVENPSVRSLSDPIRFFTDREAFSNKGEYVIYRPLAALSFAANYALSGYRPTSYHAVNIILHALCGALVYFFFFAAFERRIFSFFVALLFLLHPAQTEAVSWISARGNPLFLAFLLLSLLCYRQWTAGYSHHRIMYGLALLFGILSLLAKEMAVVLPVLMLVHDFSINRPGRPGEWKKRLLGIIPFGAFSGLYVLVRHLVLGETKQMEYWGGSFYASSLAMAKAFAYYARLMFMPRPLMVEYMVAIPQTILQPTVIISLSILTAVAALWLLTYRRLPVIGFGIAWFFVSLLPVSNIIPLQALLNERFLYLPSVGFCAILAAPSLFVCAKSRPVAFKAVLIALTSISVGYAALTYNRNKDWRDSLSLWTASVAASPAGPTSRYNLGLELFRRGRYDEAIEHLKIASALQKQYPSAHGLLGNIYMAKGDVHSAILEYEVGLRQAPRDERLLHNMAVAWLEMGNLHAFRGENGRAAYSFLKALEYEPDLAQAKEKLGEARDNSETKNSLAELEPGKAIE
jgi:tetratricopeptide (TPR) repeat protein